jgi:hypothetical protein
MSNAAERVERLRQKRRDSGLKEMRFWVKDSDQQLASEISKMFQERALSGEKQEAVDSLKKNLDVLLGLHGNWQDAMESKYGFLGKRKPSTVKQRKYAYRVSISAGVDLPDNFTLADCYLLGDWIAQTKKDHKLDYVYSFLDRVQEIKTPQ